MRYGIVRGWEVCVVLCLRDVPATCVDTWTGDAVGVPSVLCTPPRSSLQSSPLHSITPQDPADKPSGREK
jgi:hypothetical protein